MPAIKKYFTEEERKAAKKIQNAKWRKNNKDKINEYTKRWQKNNRDKANKYVRRWQKNNRDKVNETRRRWRENNKDKINERNRIWRENNPDKYNASIKRWTQNNPDKVNTILKRWREKYEGGVIYGLYVDNELIYIGQTKNMGLRINHHKSNAKRKYKKNLEMYTYLFDKEFTYKILEKKEDEKERLAREKVWIEQYKPRFNIHFNVDKRRP